MTRAPKAPKISERALSQQIQRLFALADCIVYSSEQGYRKEPGGTRSTPGQADLLVFLPPQIQWRQMNQGFFEVKTPMGLKEHHRLAPLNAPPTAGQMKAWRKVRGQAAFAALCRARAIPYGIGGMDEAWAFLESVGLARRDASDQYLLVKGAR